MLLEIFLVTIGLNCINFFAHCTRFSWYNLQFASFTRDSKDIAVKIFTTVELRATSVTVHSDVII